MAITLKFRTIVTRDTIQVFDYTNSIATGDGAILEQVAIPASTTQEVDLTFAFAKLQAFYLTSDKAVTLKTNSSGSPDETIALVANVPQFYPGGANLFGHDVTKIFVVNGVGAVANVEMYFALDTTP